MFVGEEETPKKIITFQPAAAEHHKVLLHHLSSKLQLPYGDRAVLCTAPRATGVSAVLKAGDVRRANACGS